MGTQSDPLLAGLEKTPDGVRLGDCVLVEKLGSGGMGAVYLAKHLNFDMDVAVKVLPFHIAQAHSTAVARFQKEARSTVRVDHPHIVRVFHVGEERGVHYLVMEYVDGESADIRVGREGPLPERDALEIAIAAGDALAAAHRQGILHRDVKPANILIRFRDGWVKLADLGLAKALASKAGDSALTAAGQMLGTPAYMSPEQAEDASRADERSDVYSLGATLYALLSGKAPFEASQLYSLLLMVTRDEPKDLRSVRPEVTENAADAVKKLMAKSRDARPQTMEEAVGLLRSCMEAAPSAGARGLERPEMAGERKVTITGEGVRTAPLEATADAVGDVTADMPEGPPSAPSPPSVPSAPVALAAPTSATADLPAVGTKSGAVVGVVAILATALVVIVAIAPWKSGETGQGGTADGQESEAADLIAAGRTLREAGLPDKAQDKLAEALSLAPDNEEAKRALAELRQEVARRKLEAERAAAHERWLNKGLDLQLEGRSLEAAEAYKKAAEFEPEGSKKAREAANKARAQALLDSKSMARAIENCTVEELDAALAGLSAERCDPLLRRLPAEKVPERLAFRHMLLTRGWGEFKGHDKYVRSVDFSPDGRLIAAGAWDTKAIVWDASTGKTLKTLEGEDEWLMYVSFSPDGRSLATAGRRKKEGKYSGQVILWDVETGKRTKAMEGGREGCSCAVFSPDGSSLVTGRSWKERGARRGDAVMWDVELGTPKIKFDDSAHTVSCIAFSSDGRHLATAHSWHEGDKGFGNAVLWDASTGEKERAFEGHEGRVHAVAFSPDGRLLATGSADNTAAVWEVSSGAKLRALEGHEGRVSSVAFSRDGRFIVTGGHDNTAVLWEVSTGKKLTVLEGHGGSVSSVRFSPDGRHLATGSSDQTVRLWLLPEELQPEEE